MYGASFRARRKRSVWSRPKKDNPIVGGDGDSAVVRIRNRGCVAHGPLAGLNGGKLGGLCPSAGLTGERASGWVSV